MCSDELRTAAISGKAAQGPGERGKNRVGVSEMEKRQSGKAGRLRPQKECVKW